MLRLVPSLKPYAEPLTNAMVEFYLMSQVFQMSCWLLTIMYTETKKFSNTLQIRIFITEIHVEITQTEWGILLQ